MRKRDESKALTEITPHNPVAKFAHLFNKSVVYADKRKYQRKAKHRGLEPFLNALT